MQTALPIRPRSPPRSFSQDFNHFRDTQLQDGPSSQGQIRQGSSSIHSTKASFVDNGVNGYMRGSSTLSRKPVGSRPSMSSRQRSLNHVKESDATGQSDWSLPQIPSISTASDHARTYSEPMLTICPPHLYTSDYDDISAAVDKAADEAEDAPPVVEQLQYHHTFEPPQKKPIPSPSPEPYRGRGAPKSSHSATGSSVEGSGDPVLRSDGTPRSQPQSRPASAMTLGSELHSRGRSFSPAEIRSETSLSPHRHSRGVSNGRSPDVRASTIDLLNIPYAQQTAHHNLALDNAQLRGSVGKSASLLDTRKTLEMYRANVRKTNDAGIQYEFAVFMVNAALEEPTVAPLSQSQRDASPVRDAQDREELLTEAKQILQKLADRSHVYSQYYLADGYFSGLFNKSKEDHEHAFPLFVSAGKHGHAEAVYRAALCYEFAWGCRKDYAKAVQFYRMAASKNHPGASTRLGLACLHGEMGLAGKYREGVKWLKHATDAADPQHNQAPFELGLLHIHGYGDDIFKDEGYAAQLLTKAAELGHPEASLRMGEAYEHGLLTCPKDPALSIHFYTGAAGAGIPKAMMALCAWYMVGAEPVLEKDEVEAYEWARRSAESDYAKAQYAVGYFTEMGIGCRRDPLEANVWYVRAADRGEEHAKQRLAIIRAAETGDAQPTNTTKKGKDGKQKKSWKPWEKSG